VVAEAADVPPAVRYVHGQTSRSSRSARRHRSGSAVPSDTYFSAGAIDSLRQVPATQVLVVTDADTGARGAVDEVRHHLVPAGVRVFSDLRPEPTEEEIRAGVQVPSQMQADLVVVVGGVSRLAAQRRESAGSVG
jgi:alcohol dehydrogenase class IV